MSFKRFLYILLVIVVAGISALGGAVAGGYGVYEAAKSSAALPAPVAALPASSTNPVTTLTLTRPIFKPRSPSLFKKLDLPW